MIKLHFGFVCITVVLFVLLGEGFLQGEAIIRPSSKSVSHLTVTWKVAEGIYQHIDVKEEGKQHQFSLGKTLLIGSDVSLQFWSFCVLYCQLNENNFDCYLNDSSWMQFWRLVLIVINKLWCSLVRSVESTVLRIRIVLFVWHISISAVFYLQRHI